MQVLARPTRHFAQLERAQRQAEGKKENQAWKSQSRREPDEEGEEEGIVASYGGQGAGRGEEASSTGHYFHGRERNAWRG